MSPGRKTRDCHDAETVHPLQHFAAAVQDDVEHPGHHLHTREGDLDIFGWLSSEVSIKFASAPPVGMKLCLPGLGTPALRSQRGTGEPLAQNGYGLKEQESQTFKLARRPSESGRERSRKHEAQTSRPL